ncbi:MAG: hypothetical protein AAF208_12835 [Cyanobacteria bacterium P01_A01_bin.45]
MLAIIVNDQVLKPQRVCQNCLLADNRGEPRWKSGKLYCGQAIRKPGEQRVEQYECLMGFKVVNIE